jgi:RNA polymerase sigma-70 factor (ECF subfamily)
MSSLPPHDLIAAIRNRDPHALSWVYETYGPRLFSYLLRRLGDPDLARDAHHDVFVRFLERADTFEDRGVPLIAWLFRLARNLSIDLQRRQGRTIPFRAMVVADYSADDGQSHLTLLAESQALRMALASLPPIYRQVLLLRFEYHLSLPETARQLGRTLGATKALQTRAVQLLRERMSSNDRPDERLPSPPMA